MSFKTHDVDADHAGEKVHKAATHEFSASLNGSGDGETRSALIQQARSQFTRTRGGDSLDTSGLERLYGGGEGVNLPTFKGMSGKFEATGTLSREGREEKTGHGATDSTQSKSVEVKHGDSLWKIARHQLGEHASNSQISHYVREIARQNGMADPFHSDKHSHHHHKNHQLHAGQVLKLPTNDGGHQGSGQTSSREVPAPPAPSGDAPPAPSGEVPAPPTPPKEVPAPPAPPKEVPAPPTPPKEVPAPPAPPKEVPAPPTPPKEVPAPPTPPKEVPAPPTPPKEVPAPPAPPKEVPAPPAPPKDVPAPPTPPKEVPAPPAPYEETKEQEKQKDGTTKRNESELLEQEKSKLTNNLQSLSPSERERVHDNMQQFEERSKIEHLPPQEVRKTYEQVNRLYESKDDYPVLHKDKELLADQIMQHAARPHNIDQGQHPTCGVTALESATFSKNPSAAAKVIADVGTKGSYTANDGTKVHLRPGDFDKDTESSTNPPKDGDRSYASKLFQETALNLFYQSQGKRYVETPATPGDRSSFGLPDKSEVVDASGKRENFTGINMRQLGDVDAQINTKGDTSHFLVHYDVSPAERGGKVQTFHTEDQFKTQLENLKKANGFPVTIFVDSTKPPFNMGTAEGAGGSGSGHAVTITGYNSLTGRVEVANQWGSKHNHTGTDGVRAHELYEAMVIKGDDSISYRLKSWVWEQLGE
jgi:LysM domain